MTDRRLDRSDLPVHVIAVGEFGRVIGEALQDRIGNIEVTQNSTDHEVDWPGPADWPTARAHIFVAARNYQLYQELIAESAAKWRIPFIEAVVEGLSVRVGPVVIPNHGACYRCFRARFRQNSMPDDGLGEIVESSERPAGILHLFAANAAYRLAEQICCISNYPEKVGGSIWVFNLKYRETGSERISPMHGCVTCGLRRNERTRTYQALQSELQYLYDNTATDGEHKEKNTQHLEGIFNLQALCCHNPEVEAQSENCIPTS